MPQPSTYKVQSALKVLSEDSTMANLIDLVSKQLKVDLVQKIFSSGEAKIIKRISTSAANAPNKVIWKCTANGHFSMKSAYDHLQKELNDLHKDQPSKVGSRSEEWACYWKVNVPNVTKVFVWRAYLDSLPTNLNLSKKKIVESSMCPICLREQDSVIHVLWECSSTMDVWGKCSRNIQKALLLQIPLEDSFTTLVQQQRMVYWRNVLSLQ